MAKAKIKTMAAPAAQTREEAELAVARIGEVQRELTRQETVLNDQVAALKTAAEEAAKGLKLELTDLQARVQRFCEANRTELTNGGKTKTVLFATGEVKWRARPPSVSVRGAEAVIAFLKATMDGRFVRTKDEVDKEAMLADPDAARKVPGVKIGSEGEDFVIEPLAVQLAGAA
ncbi:MAG: host-nuclease inhibitor Gam family protein [Pseudomonadota bacterium]